jgi:hypothetical protein
MYITGIIHAFQAFFTHMDTNNNVQLYMAHSPCFHSPLLTPSCLSLRPLFDPFSLTWNPPSCDRIHPPRSQVARKLTPFDPPSPQPSPFQIPRTPNTLRLTTMTSGTIRHLLLETVPDSGSRDRVVVFVGAGCWGNLRRDAGNLEWGGVENGKVSSRVT